jgi:Sigma-70, region 4
MNKVLEQAIERLPEQYRTVVMMRDVEEMTTAETPGCLSLTEDNIKIRLHRDHGMLRSELYESARISEANAFPFHAPRCDRIVTNVFARLATLETLQSMLLEILMNSKHTQGIICDPTSFIPRIPCSKGLREARYEGSRRLQKQNVGFKVC